MRSTKYTKEFRTEAVRQYYASEKSVVEIAKRLGISYKTLYLWLRANEQSENPVVEDSVRKLQNAFNQLQTELLRTTMERNILKKILTHFTSNSVQNRHSLPSSDSDLNL
jgi:transposase